jgi:D-serine deaminase-like pyridoxal phosphate-dependent protein
MPARPGHAIAEIDTPALVVDRAVLHQNLDRMADFVRRYPGVRVRPHAKSHKCVAIARLQIARGAVGLCAQKLGEALPFLEAGVADVLVTNQIVGAGKIARLAEIAARHPGARIGVLVDAASNAGELAAACARRGARLDVYVELDVGQDRAGVTSPEEVVALGRVVAGHPALALRGLHAYHGGAQHRRTADERRGLVAAASEMARRSRDALLAAGLPCERITGAGTGTFSFECASGVYDEIQPGSYALMDVDYAKNEETPGAPRFEPALTILSTVTSVRGARVTLDAGTKAQSTDSGPAEPACPGWRVRGVYDEHAVLDRDPQRGDAEPLALGDKIRLVPGHVDPTVNLHDWFVVVEGERVIDVWPIEARGGFF